MRASTESLHSVPASAEKETPSQVPLTQLFSSFPLFSFIFFSRECGQRPQFLLWYPVKAVLELAKRGLSSESWGNIIQLPPCDPKTHNKPCGPQLSGQGKSPGAQCLLHIRTFRGMHAHCASSPFGHVEGKRSTTEKEKHLYRFFALFFFFFLSELTQLFDPTLISVVARDSKNITRDVQSIVTLNQGICGVKQGADALSGQ